MKIRLYIYLAAAGVASLPAETPIQNPGSGIGQSGSPNSVFDQAEADLKEAPPLFESETADLGPQYLLLQGRPAHDWFQAAIDLQWMRTSNPTLDDASVSKATDLAVATAQFSILTPEKKIWGGRINGSGGLRYQLFRYGTIHDTEINGQPVDNNDFEATTLFSNLQWKKGNWRAIVGLDWRHLENDTQGSGFYQEFVPNWGLSHDFFPGSNTRIQIGYRGAYYFTDSQTFLPQFDDLNDRLTNSLFASLLYRINAKCFIEPSVRVSHADYTHNTNGSREDLTLRTGATLTYYLNKNISLRLQSSYQKRESDGLGIVDYENWDIGLGTTLSASF